VTKRNLTAGIVVKKEKTLLAVKNRYKIYLYFFIFRNILTVKNRNKIYHILTVKNYHKIYHFFDD